MLEYFKIHALSLEEFNLKEQIGIDYWHSNILNVNGVPVAGGFAESRDKSRKIAFSEYLERKKFKEIKNSTSEIQEKWGLNIVSSGCGFAAGFNEYNTIIRSVGEGLERWTMSKWIDDGFYINEVDTDIVSSGLDPASKWFFQQFDSVKLYRKEVVIYFSNEFIKFNFGFSLGLIDKGIFPGSYYSFGDSTNWQHALLESYRHYLLFKNTPAQNVFPDNKVRYFANNANVALTQIQNATRKDWPTPSVILHNSEYYEDTDSFLARTIIDGWRPWNEGSIERFLY